MNIIWGAVSLILITAGPTQITQAVGTRIIGGKCAAIKNYPFFVSLVIQAQERYDKRFVQDEIFCGGSIIGPRWIITSIACILFIQEAEVDLNDVYIRSGTAYWINRPTGRKHGILKYYFENPEDDGEIALVKVNQSFANADRIKVKLAGSNYPQNGGASCTALGFGATSINNPTFSRCLKMIDIKIIEKETCKKAFEAHPKIALNEKVMCAGWTDATRGTCIGDIGGPLVNNGVLIGITTLVTPCELFNIAPFVQVSKFQGRITNYEYLMGEVIGVVFVDR